MANSLESVELTEVQQAELSNLGCDDLAARETLTLDTLRTELDKLKANTELDKACRDVLSRSGSQTKVLMSELVKNPSASSDSADTAPVDEKKKPKPTPEISATLSEGDLPVAPVTTFNIIRLIQLGYIPLEKPTGKFGQVKWVFYGPTVASQYVNGKVNGWVLDWAGGKQNNAYRAMLEADISKVNDELKKYQKDTATTFGMKAELEKQLTLLESLKNEKDPKRIMEIANDYVTSRSKTHFSAGAVAYDMPATRKTDAQLDTEIARAETKTQAREDRIKADEQDLKALTTKGAKDSTGKVRMTKEEIEEQNRRRVERATSMSDHQIAKLEKQLAEKQADQQKFQGEFDAAKSKIQSLNGELNTARLNFTGRTQAEVNTDLATERAKSKVNDKTINALQAELRVINEVSRIEGELRAQGMIDGRGKPTTGVGTVVYDAHTDLEGAKTEVKRLEGDIAQARKNKEKLIKDATKKGQDALEAHAKEVAYKEKRIQQRKSSLPGLQEAEIRVAEVNGKIKDVQAKLAAMPPVPAGGTKSAAHIALETELAQLYGQKNAAAQAFDVAIKSNGGRNDTATKSAVDGQTTEVKKELEKLTQISTEMDTVKAKIDAIQAEAEAAKTALNNERDPVKAKKLRAELPAKINAANQQIFELNTAGKKIADTFRLNWKHVPDVQVESILKKNLLLAKFVATPQGLIAKAETFGQTANGQKTMKLVYGGLKWVGIAGAVRTVANDLTNEKLNKGEALKTAGLDALDAGMGFLGMIPGGNIVSGLYDIGMAGKQFVTGKDINGRNVSTTQTFVRLGFGIVGLVPVVGNVVKGAAAAKGLTGAVRAVEAVESTANVAMKGAVLAQVGTLAYDVVDVTANAVRDPVSTAMRVLKGQEQPGIIFTKPVK